MTNSPVAIITGAGSGIGQATARLFADAGYRIALVGRDESRLAGTAAEIGEIAAEPGASFVVPTDITDHAQAQRAVDLTVDRWGRLDVLVNNAGFAPVAAASQTSPELLQQVFAVNALGPGYLISRALPVLARSGHDHARRGCVINVSSMATVSPYPGLFAYAAAKAAVESFVRSLVAESGDGDIRAFAVAPGAVETTMLRGIVSESDLPKDQTLDPSEVAAVILACAQGERDDEIGSTIYLPSPG